MRIIQRFGRIDRIGSIHSEVQLVNFWPTQDLNKYINLKNRVEARMALVDIAATAEDNILQAKDLEDLIREDLKYRDKQLMRLKDEVLDLEDFAESVSLSEFTLDDFRSELSHYITQHKRELEEAPLGLYAVVPPDAAYPAIRPGVIYCLARKASPAGVETVNPLNPYFLAYVHDDGTVRYNFTHPKQILEIFRLLALGKTDVNENLCQLFDNETAHGKNMTAYSKLLDHAIATTHATLGKRAVTNLLAGRGGQLFDDIPEPNPGRDRQEFELVTWLVIKAGGNG